MIQNLINNIFNANDKTRAKKFIKSIHKKYGQPRLPIQNNLKLKFVN